MRATRTSLTFLLLLLPALAGSQPLTVYNPNWIEFTSPDHETNVKAYTVEYWLDGVDPATGQPYTVSLLEKTAMTVTSGVYRAPLTSLIPLPAIQVGKTYKATVQAIGLDDQRSVRSELSNPFALAPVPARPATVSIR